MPTKRETRTVLITGGTGSVGKALVADFAEVSGDVHTSQT